MQYLIKQAYKALSSASSLPSIYQIKTKQRQIKENAVQVIRTQFVYVRFQRDFIQVLNARIDPNAMSSNGNCLIAVFQEKEGYQAIKAHLVDLRSQIQQYTEVVVGAYSYKLSYYLRGDYKFLLCLGH